MCSMHRCVFIYGCSDGILCYFCKGQNPALFLYSYFKDFVMLMLQMEIAMYKKKTYCVLGGKSLLFYSAFKYGVLTTVIHYGKCT